MVIYVCYFFIYYFVCLSVLEFYRKKRELIVCEYFLSPSKGCSSVSDCLIITLFHKS